jgi:hypothetical protein
MEAKVWEGGGGVESAAHGAPAAAQQSFPAIDKALSLMRARLGVERSSNRSGGGGDATSHHHVEELEEECALSMDADGLAEYGAVVDAAAEEKACAMPLLAVMVRLAQEAAEEDIAMLKVRRRHEPLRHQQLQPHHQQRHPLSAAAASLSRTEEAVLVAARMLAHHHDTYLKRRVMQTWWGHCEGRHAFRWQCVQHSAQTWSPARTQNKFSPHMRLQCVRRLGKGQLAVLYDKWRLLRHTFHLWLQFVADPRTATAVR